MDTFTNSEDPDEMPHYAAFHQGLHCLLRQNQSSGKEIQHCLEIVNCDSLILAWVQSSIFWQYFLMLVF